MGKISSKPDKENPFLHKAMSDKSLGKNYSLEAVIINCVIRSFINYKTISNDPRLRTIQQKNTGETEGSSVCNKYK